MNPLTNVRNVTKLSQRELQGAHGKTSWHDEYKDSAWIFVGGLPFDLTEGDILAIFSQWGEIVNLNLIRDKATGKSKGFGFICYENQKSTVLAVDNFNGIKILTRTIRVDHVKDYKPPKDSDKLDDITRQLYEQGCAPETADSLQRQSVDGYEILESDEEDNYRDDGFGSHSVLKGLKNSSDSRPEVASSASRAVENSTDRSHRTEARDKYEERSSQIAKPPRCVSPSPPHREKERSKKSSKRRKKSKAKHSSKKHKERRKHKKKVSSSESSSSSSSSDSDSDSDSSSSEDSDEKHKSRKRRHRS